MLFRSGKVALTPRGEYSSTATYEELDVVRYEGSSYVVNKPCSGITPVEGEYYTLLAEKGEPGKPGDKGDPGDSASLEGGTEGQIPYRKADGGLGLMVTEVGVGAVTSVASGALVAKILKEPVTGNLVKQLAINGAKIGGAGGGVATGVNTVANVIASFVMRIKTHAWQIVGTIYVPEKKMTSIVNGLNDEFKDALGDYKFVAVPTCKVITDGFRAHYKWSETGTVYFIIIDKEIPEDLKVLKSDIKVDSKTLKEIKSGKKSNKDGESVNESTETKDEDPDDGDEDDETKNED